MTSNGATMVEIFLEAPIELKLMILGAIGAFIVVAYNGIRGTDERLSLIIVLTRMRNGGKMRKVKALLKNLYKFDKHFPKDMILPINEEQIVFFSRFWQNGVGVRIWKMMAENDVLITIAFSLFTAGVVIIALCILLNNKVSAPGS